MEPTLHHGDMIWMKTLCIDEVRIGDIATLSSPEFGSISHRIIDMELISREQYLVETKGDANSISEYWIVGSDETVYIVMMSIPLGGYVLDFISSLYGIVVVILLGITTMIVVLVRSGKVKQV